MQTFDSTTFWFILISVVALVLFSRFFCFHPCRRLPKILKALRKESKTFDELQKIASMDPQSLDVMLKFMEFQLFYVVRRWRGPWDKHGNCQSPWVFDITLFGAKALDNPDPDTHDPEDI